MFTHQATPTRVEILLDTMREFSDRKITREILINVLQPDGLPDGNSKKAQPKEAILAAKKLDLIEETSEGRLVLNFKPKDKRNSRQILVEAIEEKVLVSADIEPHFALFYSYLLSLNSNGSIYKTGATWVLDYLNSVYGEKGSSKPFNDTQLTGLNRWYSYTGLGWYDPSTNKVLQANPYERLLRRLPFIFGKTKKLTSEEFMGKLAVICPELDGGDIFLQVFRNQPYNSEAKVCTLGLSHALIDLHQDKKIRLTCPRDSRGWSIELAEPPSGDGLDSSKIDSIEFLSN